ncbi:MAG TPA: pyridoxal-phosphate dependent enzyme [Saprospiraceae bacterium]|nr:pyridoxal-phosphate dependent enzyme [Saprospiraceae bacterium]HPG08244.1 pyridoxal-phosphate dependent enzyme [Saprospiraceae bacterium]HPQ98949.1 pyridoxal-phosphate dependent enzyme [Saprospiraceae bacterium]HQU51729.1 pyridoxal-phosphate dependent enzyme [Saprospiraceae bacterium]HRV86079.1 pyridoxal-phosphate dependent enzyme [Saprospiraceae bacterium]
MHYCQNVLETIGNTPMIRLNKVVKDVPALVLGKVETYNPGHSIKDRMALKMIEVAEDQGLLRPGGTIIECTSGNTGMGLALAGVIKGYRCIFTTNDKQSKEKIDMLKALGAEVIVCPTNVTPDDPRSYYSVADKLSKEIPNSFWCNQYDNLANSQAHYESTGPEIWDQTEGKITHLVVGVGTGGTVSGTAKFLKEKNPNIKVWGIDTYGSVFKKYKETGIFDDKEIYPYITEGIGEDILPKNVDFSLIDHFEKVTDKDGALAARRLAREEGLLLGYSAGSALAGLLQMADQLTAADVVVVIFHDHGSRYVAKIFNDDWMRDRGFLDQEKSVRDILGSKKGDDFIAVKETDRVRDVFEMMKSVDISQVPVIQEGKVIGSITETVILKYLLDNPLKHSDEPVSGIMGPPFPLVDRTVKLKELHRYITRETPAVLVEDGQGGYNIITQYDLIHAV